MASSSSKSKTMVGVMKLYRRITVETQGREVSVAIEKDGVIGFIPIFKNKTAARKFAGKKAPLIELALAHDDPVKPMERA